MIVPSSNIYLLKTPFELEERNTLTFSDVNSQHTWFSNLPKLYLEDATYQRKDGVIRYPALIDNILEYNYCMYQNENFSNKWFYAYITNMEYANENMTYISIETDVFQTYQFDVTYKASFIEREHVNNDTVGLHTIPEGLETGEFICNAHIIDDAMDDIMSELCYVISATLDFKNILPTGKFGMATGRRYNGIYSGVNYYRYDTPTVINGILNEIANEGQSDGITGLFMVPTNLATIYGENSNEYSNSVVESNTPATYTNSISKMNTLDGYTPKNKKLLTYLYNYLVISNNNGATNILHYEDFSTSTCNFKIDMAITPGCSIRMIPLNYKKISENDEEGINMGKLPICSYPVDMYTNWLTQNSINVAGVRMTSDDLNVASSVTNGLASLGSSIATGNIIGGLSSVANTGINIAQSMIAKKQHELIPPQARGNLNAGDVITASGKNNFHFYKMSIREEYARIIDNYFSMYGYKVNDLKLPNITGRANWNYVKTIGANIIGDIPEEYLIKFRSLFDNGITLWHNPNTYLDYSQNNGII